MDIAAYFRKTIWDIDISQASYPRALAVQVVRIVHTVIRELADGQLNLRAMSLVYTTLLSLVPLLAVSFSVLKGFGVHNQIEPLLLNVLAPLGEKGAEITAHILGFVENIKVGVLGSIGLAFLIYTVVSLIQKIERAFNYTWRVEQSRNMASRFSDYLSVILVGPVLIFTAMGITGTVLGSSVIRELMTVEPFGELIRISTRLIPYLLVISAFAFVYVFVPNTKVRFGPALTGAVVAGVLWETTGWFFALFVVSSTKYTAIYSSFAILVVFMIWLYLSWLILLVGASVAFYTQHPQSAGLLQRELFMSNRLKERLALMCMYLVTKRHLQGGVPWDAGILARMMSMPTRPTEKILHALEDAKLVILTSAEPPAYVPARDPGSIEVREVLEMVRKMDETPHLSPARLPEISSLDGVLQKVEASAQQALGEQTFKDLAEADIAEEKKPSVALAAVNAGEPETAEGA